MKVLPVIDLLRGQVVRGIGGRRHEYRPIVSRLVSSAEPSAVACAFRDAFGLDDLYLADLDAIAGQAPAWPVYDSLLQKGFRLWVDAGLAPGTPAKLADIGVAAVVAGLESLSDADTLAEVLQRVGPQQLVFSLDIREGKPQSAVADWASHDAWTIARSVFAMGVQRLLALDLASVGEGHGTPTVELCRRCRSSYPHVEVATGGGVRDARDLLELKHAGAAYALAASALHDGRLTRADIEAISSTP